MLGNEQDHEGRFFTVIEEERTVALATEEQAIEQICKTESKEQEEELIGVQGDPPLSFS